MLREHLTKRHFLEAETEDHLRLTTITPTLESPRHKVGPPTTQLGYVL